MRIPGFIPPTMAIGTALSLKLSGAPFDLGIAYEFWSVEPFLMAWAVNTAES